MMTAAEMEANQLRCRQILECKEQIKFWEAKLDVLESEHEMNLKLTRLRLDAPSTWRILSREERHEKSFILAALESKELPSALKDFPNGTFPPHVRNDRDILMKRVKRDDFASEEDRLFVPPKLRSDKEVIMTIAKKHPQVIECMSCELRDDIDVLRVVLGQKLSMQLHFLQHFSERLRDDKETMIEVMKHPDGLSSLAFCSHALRNDKDFFLEVIKCGNHKAEVLALRYASQRLQDDFELVHMAVCKSGLNLKHASYSLRRDEKIVIAATMENAMAFRYCLPGQLKQKLIEDRSFVLKVIRHVPTHA